MSALRDLVAAATPGPWEPWVEGDVFIDGDLAWGGDNCVTSSTAGSWLEITRSRENIRLMALAPELAVLLADAMEEIVKHGSGMYGASLYINEIKADALLSRFAELERRAAQPADGAS